MTNIVFMGTPTFAAPILEGIIENGYNVLAVVTQPDRPVGRKRVLHASPVKEVALKYGIKVFQPVKLSGSDEMQEIIDLQPDLIVTAAYGQFLPTKLIESAKKPGVELLAGIPSVVYGFFGMVVIVPFIRNNFGGGNSILAASILLGMMILPTIISQSEASIRAVPESYYEGSLALGATHERSVFCAVLPAAKSGILAGIILGVGRAIGETMAVIMVAGNQARMPGSILEGVRTMTANIVIEMGYAEGLHREALIATGVVLFVFILIINLAFSIVKMRGERN